MIVSSLRACPVGYPNSCFHVVNRQQCPNEVKLEQNYPVLKSVQYSRKYDVISFVGLQAKGTLGNFHHKSVMHKLAPRI